MVCCVIFPPPPHISCALWNTVGTGIILSVLPVLPLTCLGNCFTGGCQMKKYPIWERQRQPVNICPPCLFCPLTDMCSSRLSVCLSIPVRCREDLCHQAPASSVDLHDFVLFVAGFQVLNCSPFASVTSSPHQQHYQDKVCIYFSLFLKFVSKCLVTHG